MVGLLESVLTAAVVDELTGTPSDKNRECTGLGLANMASSVFGGIAGCGMIGQAVGNVKYGGRGRLSTLFAGVFLLILMVALKDWVSRVPVVALVAIMVMVSASTFDWGSLRNLLRYPRLSSGVMVATVAITVATHNLAAGVLAGVLLSGVFFAFKVSHMMQVTLREAAMVRWNGRCAVRCSLPRPMRWWKRSMCVPPPAGWCASTSAGRISGTSPPWGRWTRWSSACASTVHGTGTGAGCRQPAADGPGAGLKASPYAGRAPPRRSSGTGVAERGRRGTHFYRVVLFVGLL
jgi:hypothetical protein